ncbi:MAG: tRNA lysidine(34) synthetase TilS [Clostridia bacterium]|nr:tRNA lysidine(34) synthetase TilS [Clostridia bacterium]
MTVKEHLMDTVRREGMFPSGCAVVVGLSGGADSVVLLHALLSLRRELQLSHIVAVHIDHQLRGEEAFRDKQFAEAFCRQWSVPFYAYSYNVQKLATENGKGIEEMGRQLRYRAFEEVASQFENARIATAHNADDNAETVLLHLCRGCGIHGLIGIQPMRGNIVRPLIDCPRSEIEAYCLDNGLEYVTDSTNADITYSRNRIRHQILPAMRQINSAVDRSLLRLTWQARETEAFLEREAEACWQTLLTEHAGVYRKEPLLSAEPAIQRVLLRKMIALVGANAEERHITRILELLPANGAVTLPQNVCFRILNRTVSVTAVPDAINECCLRVEIGVPIIFSGNTYQIAEISRKEYEQKLNNRKFLFKNHLDCAMINGDLFLRSRQEGDAYRPAGRGCKKTLKKLLNEAAIPSEQRDSLPLLCDDRGILIPFGFPCDERVRITEQSEKILMFEKVGE